MDGWKDGRSDGQTDRQTKTEKEMEGINWRKKCEYWSDVTKFRGFNNSTCKGSCICWSRITS